MTTGQPIRFPSDRNKYNNEYMESLQLQINLNQNNLEVNRLYKETGQLPASTQMMDTRSNEEKLADIHGLKQSIISDLAPIAEPMFASAVIQGVIDSPLNVDNSLFRYLAQNASTFAQTLSKKYKFGIAGDVNDVAIMVQFLEDAYNKTKNSFQSIKGYINSNTNEGVRSRSNILSENDTDNLINEITNTLKKIKYIEAELRGNYANFNIAVGAQLTGQLNNLYKTLADVAGFLPNSTQMQTILKNLQMEEYQNPNGIPTGMAFWGTPELISVLKILKSLPKPSSVATLTDKLEQAFNNHSFQRMTEVVKALINLFSQLLSPTNRIILDNFKTEFIDRANQEMAREQEYSRINTINEIQRMNQNMEYDKKAQRVYVINPADDPVHIIGNMNLGGDVSSLGGTDYSGFNSILSGSTDYSGFTGSTDDTGFSQARTRSSNDSGFSGLRSAGSTNSSFNTPPGSIGSTVYSQPNSSISGVSQPMPVPSVDRINEYDAFVNNIRNGDPLLYANSIRQLNNIYADLDGYGVLIDPDFAAVYQPAPAPASASLSSSDVSLAGTPVSVPLNHPNFAPVYPKADDVGKAPSLKIPSSVSFSSSSSTPISDISSGTPGVKQSTSPIKAPEPPTGPPGVKQSTSSIKAPEPPTVSSKQPAGRYAPLTSDNMKETRKHYYLLNNEVADARDSKNEQMVDRLENAFFNELGKTLQAAEEAQETQRFALLTEKERKEFGNKLHELQTNYNDFAENPDNKAGIVNQLASDLAWFKNSPGYHQLMGYRRVGTGLKRVKKGRGLYSPFGDSEINHKNLENNILTIRRKSKTNYMDLPSKHISKHMKNIIHNIVGGKIANFEDIQNLNDEERNYLSKVVKKSNLQDRLSVPAPSKDQSEKDNHQWEVMRGEIMAGNDSHELVKKFKILTMKLTRQGLLPKNEVMDLFADLVALGY